MLFMLQISGSALL